MKGLTPLLVDLYLECLYIAYFGNLFYLLLRKLDFQLPFLCFICLKLEPFCLFCEGCFFCLFFLAILLIFSHAVTSNSLQPHELLSCPSPSPRACSNSCPLSHWCHPAISSSVFAFPSSLLSFPASGSFQMSQFFTSGGQSIGASASASVLPMNIQDWFPLGLIGLISLQSKGLLRVFSNTTVQKYKFFSPQPSLWSNSHILTWLLGKLQLWFYGPLLAK